MNYKQLFSQHLTPYLRRAWGYIQAHQTAARIAALVTLAAGTALVVGSGGARGDEFPDVSSFSRVIQEIQGDNPVQIVRVDSKSTTFESPISPVGTPSDTQLIFEDCPGAYCPVIPTPPVGVTVTINVYESSEGRGYEIVYLTGHAGTIWRKIENVGPEEFREMEWAPISPLPTPEAPQ